MSQESNPFLNKNCSNNFVHLHKTLQDEEHLYFVLEFCPGGDLLSLCEAAENGMGILDEEAGAFYAANIVLILKDLHDKGVIHRDIKSENFLIASDGYLKLSDFGDSKDNMHARGRAYTLCGTNKFMAPEVVQERDEGYDFSCEWWGLGCLLYDLLCGHEPFQEENIKFLKDSIQTRDPDFPNWVSGDARSLILQLMEKDPEKRMVHVESIKSHPFFNKINWAHLEKRLVKSPFVPSEEQKFSISETSLPEFLNQQPVNNRTNALGPAKLNKFNLRQSEQKLDQTSEDPFEYFDEDMPAPIAQVARHLSAQFGNLGPLPWIVIPTEEKFTRRTDFGTRDMLSQPNNYHPRLTI